MTIRWGRVAWGVAGLAVAAGLAGVFVPKLDAERMREPLRGALERTLGRKVEFGEVRYQVFPTPGLSATDLVIPDDREFGLEPLAYVGELQAGVSFPSLLTGRLSIASVRLVEASVNLARKDGVGWNFARLLERVFAGVKEKGGAPAVEIRASRINFRNGTLKSAVYLNEVDVDLEPPQGPGGDLVWKYEASPARTDRAELGFGRFTGGGRWTPAGGRFAVDMELERSAISELLTLATGRDLGVEGRFTTRATLDGQLENLKVKGQLELEDVDRPGFFGLRSNRYSLPYEGVVDVVGQTLEVKTGAGEGKAALPLKLKLRCERLLADPKWEAGFEFEELPAAALLDLAQRLGVKAPEGMQVGGVVVGGMEYSQLKQAGGRVVVRGASLGFGEQTVMTAEEALVEIVGTEVRVEAAGPKAEIRAVWDVESEALKVEAKTAGVTFGELRAVVAGLPGVGLPAPAGECKEGALAGVLRYERERGAEGEWGGELALSRAVCAVEGLSGDVKIERAAWSMGTGGWSLKGARAMWGRWEVEGDVVRGAAARRGVRFALAVKEAEGEDIDRFFRPALTARPGFIDRTLRRRPAVPAWLKGRHAEGTVRIGRLRVGEEEFGGVTARLYWDGEHVEMPELTARWEGATASGRGSVGLGAESLRYQWRGRVEGWTTKVGQWDGELEATAATLGGAVAGGSRVTGQVSSKAVEVNGETARAVMACVDYDGARAGQRMKIGCAEAQMGGEVWTGRGEGAGDGKVVVELGAGRRAMKVAGTMGGLDLIR